MKWKLFFTFGLLSIMPWSTLAHAEEAQAKVAKAGASKQQKPVAEQWFNLKFVGEEIVEEKKEIPLTSAKALELFQKEEPKLKADWLGKLGQPVESAENARPMLDIEHMRKQDGEAFSKVVAFSKNFAQVMVLKRKGNYLWHHYEACLANFKVPRNTEIDAIFELAELDRIYTFRVKGIGYGSTPNEVFKALGKPDWVKIYQKVGMYRHYYLKDDLTVSIDDGIVRMMTRGVDDGVKEEIKKNGPNVVRRMN